MKHFDEYSFGFLIMIRKKILIKKILNSKNKMEEKIQNPFRGGVMLYNLPSSTLEGITKLDHPLREGVGLLFISNTEVSLPEHPPSKISIEQGVGESFFLCKCTTD